MALLVLAVLYTTALFAGFFAPYTYDEVDVLHSWCPPTKIHFFDKDKDISFRPFVYGHKYSMDEFYKRTYYEDKEKVHFIKFFARGSEYKFLGLFKTNIHFFGADDKVFLFGADAKGRDIFSRLIYGSRISLSIGLIGASISFCIGLLVGGIAGYFGGRTDNILMRLVEMIMMIPSFYLMLALRASFPPHLSSTRVYLLIVVILSVIGWASIARVIRGMCISLREREYVLAAKATGLGHLKIVIRHILPHTFSYAIVAICLSIPAYILGEAALSMIGLGIQEPEASWGNMLSQAMGIVRIRLFPWILAPGFFILFTVMSFNIIGDFLRDVFDPKRKLS